MNKKAMLVLVIAFSAFTGFAQKTDFSGTWNINKGKSDFGTGSSTSTLNQMKMVQTTSDISIGRIYEASNWTEVLKFDGSEFTIMQPGNKRTSTIQWSGDNQELVERVTMDREDPKRGENKAVTHTMRLSDAGRTLTITSVNEYPDHDPITFIYVFDKQ